LPGWQEALIQNDDRRAGGPEGPAGVAEAMNRVLDAERKALAEVEACRLDAEKALEAARHEARTILERAERVAREIHARTEKLATTRARRMVEQAREVGDPASRETRLESAVNRLAALMTGAADA
jgi:regulator of protease activity HflC (stomatin/prohibitin superfamily)